MKVVGTLRSTTLCQNSLEFMDFYMPSRILHNRLHRKPLDRRDFYEAEVPELHECRHLGAIERL